MIESFNEEPSLARFQFRARTQWLDGGHTRTTVKDFYGAGRERQGRQRPFVIDSDLPSMFEGGNTAINPLEHLLSVVGSCLTTTLVYHAAARGIFIDAVECAVEGDIDLLGFLGVDETVPQSYEEIRVLVSIEANAPDSELDELVVRAKRYSPIAIALGQSMRFIVERTV